MKISDPLKFFVNLAKVYSVINRKFDSSLNGLGFNEFIILFHVSQARDEKMRRVDLADKLGLTASGITRLLLPMEKIGLVKREVDENDARVSYVVLGKGGKEKLAEGIERAELLCEDVLPPSKAKKITSANEVLMELGATIK